MTDPPLAEPAGSTNDAAALVGHDAAWRAWRAGLAGERMHHAWLLTGKRGLGKATFARQAARELVAEPGIRQPGATHVDILVLTPLPATPADEKKRDAGEPFQLKRNITVDQVRAVRRDLHTRPMLGSRRAIIVDPADDLEPGAANALLKSLEEPPAGTTFMLVAHRPGRLLPTIRSRCRTIAFAPLLPSQIDAVLREHGSPVEPQARAAAVVAAGGSPGAALEFLTLEMGGVHALLQQIAEGGDRDLAMRGALAAAIGARPDRRRLAALLDLAGAVLASRMREVELATIPHLADTHTELVRLSAEAATFNYDPGLLVMQITTLLARAAPNRNEARWPTPIT